jgi:predicted methyltransferase
MNPRTMKSRPTLAVLAFLAMNVAGIMSCGAADRFDAAVAAPHRSAADIHRDALDHPAELLRLAGIRPGSQVADMLAGDGYFSELLSNLVGTHGHVLMLNNSSFDKWSDGDRQKRLADNRLPNVEYRVVDLDHMNLAPNSLDAIVLSKVYHDLYWVDTTGIWPKFDTSGVLDQLVGALKPGGVLLLIDHSAKVGRGSADASSLHRIEEAYARQDFGKRGMRVVKTSNLLRRADDPRDQVSYKEPIIGKTDRFVLVLRKQQGRR